MSQPDDAGSVSGPVADLCGWLAAACRAVAGAALLLIVGINGANVVARYFFGMAFSWAEELMLFLMILSVFSGAVAVTWRNIHIRVDAFVDRAPPGLQRLLHVIATVASMAVLLTISASSYHIVSLLYQLDQRTDALDAPMWIPQAFVTIGLVLIALLMGVRLVLSRAR